MSIISRWSYLSEFISLKLQNLVLTIFHCRLVSSFSTMSFACDSPFNRKSYFAGWRTSLFHLHYYDKDVSVQSYAACHDVCCLPNSGVRWGPSHQVSWNRNLEVRNVKLKYIITEFLFMVKNRPLFSEGFLLSKN